MFFPVITKNSNCEMFQLRILGSLKNPIFRWEGGCLQKTDIEQGDYLKRGAWAVCRFKAEVGGETWQKREGDVFEGEG